MQTFQFQITQGHVTYIMHSPLFVDVKYELVDNKVVLFDLGIPPFLFPLLKDNYGLHDQMYRAAEHNALSLKISADEAKFDLFKELGKHFQPSRP